MYFYYLLKISLLPISSSTNNTSFTTDKPIHARISLENHKSIEFHSSTGQDPLKNHKTTKTSFNVGPPFKWGFAGGPMVWTPSDKTTDPRMQLMRF